MKTDGVDPWYCGMVTLACYSILIIAGVASQSAPAAWWGNWTPHIIATQPHIVDRFFAFDSRWYDLIAGDGYSWDASRQRVEQSIAFFPLWPMSLRFIATIAPEAGAARWATMGLSAGCGAASIFVFRQVAGLVLAAPPARMATLFYAFAPSASFLLLSYPTGLINLLCLLALLAVSRRHFLAAACFTGLGMAAGPLTLGTAATVWLSALHRCSHSGWPDVRTLAYLIVCGLTSILGLLLFIVWQAFALHDALAFVHAQTAWNAPLAFMPRAVNWLGHMVITPELFGAIGRIGNALSKHTILQAEVELENAQNLLGEALILIGTYALVIYAAKQQAPHAVPIAMQAWLTVALYEWFDGASFPGHATDRLIYPAVGGFVGVAWLLRHRPTAARAVAAVLAFLLFANGFARGLGYHII